MKIAYKEIYNPDNDVRILVRSITNGFILRKFGYRITPTHQKYDGKLRSLVDISSLELVHLPARAPARRPVCSPVRGSASKNNA